MKYSALAGIVLAGTVIWILAAVGALAVANAIASDPAPPPAVDSLLDAPRGDVPGVDIAGLERYPGSIRQEYRRTEWDGMAITEVEFHVDAPVSTVIAWHREAFDSAGWTIVRSDRIHGESVYEIASGDRAATVEIERLDAVTEIEIELVEPLGPRASHSAR